MTITERLRSMLVSVVSNSSILNALQSDETRIATVFGLIALLGILSSAGTLSGAALFIIAVIATSPADIILSSLLLTTSLTVAVGVYLWITR